MAKPALKTRDKPEFTARDLYEMLLPFKTLCSKAALSAQYKTLLLTPEYVRGMSSYGQMEVKCKLQIEEECLVDAETFITILASLPSEGILLSLEEGVINWKCGNAKGRLATVVLAHPIPELKRYKMDSAYEVPAEFSQALDLGSLSCDNASLKSIGMYGITIDNRDSFRVFSCDNVTASCAVVTEEANEAFHEVTVLPPEGASLISSLAKKGGMKILPMQTGLYCVRGGTRLLVKHAAVLEKDAASILGGFNAQERSVEISPDRIAAFIRRAEAISETKSNTFVTMGIEEGQLALAFSDGVSSSDEYFLTDSEEALPDVKGIILSAAKLAKVMAKVNRIVFDYAERNVLVLYGDKFNFSYIVSGKS